MTARSAGILLYRHGATGVLEVWLGHMGGPFWAGKKLHSWSLPKGEYQADEDPLTAATREFTEEIGSPPPAADYALLGEFRQPSGKRITVFTAAADFQPGEVVSNTFPLEWPKGSGTVQDFPEIDDAQWVTEADARNKLVKGQLPILDALVQGLLERHDHP
jgi:predicted NUDIX family NTP pyrophosphohydrolase